MIRVGHRDQIKSADGRVVFRIRRVEGETSGDGSGGDEGVVGPGGGFPTRFAKVGGDPTERSGRRLVEGQDVEVGLCLLEVSLTPTPLGVGGRDQRPHGQLGQCDRGNGGCCRQRPGVGQPRKEYHRAGVEYARAAFGGGHSDRSMV